MKTILIALLLAACQNAPLKDVSLNPGVACQIVETQKDGYLTKCSDGTWTQVTMYDHDPRLDVVTPPPPSPCGGMFQPPCYSNGGF